MKRLHQELDVWIRKGCDYKWGIKGGPGAFGSGFDEVRAGHRMNMAGWFFLLVLLYPVLALLGSFS